MTCDPAEIRSHRHTILSCRKPTKPCHANSPLDQVAQRVEDVRTSTIGLVDVACDVAGDVGFPDHLLQVLGEFVAARIEEQPALATRSRRKGVKMKPALSVPSGSRRAGIGVEQQFSFFAIRRRAGAPPQHPGTANFGPLRKCNPVCVSVKHCGSFWGGGVNQTSILLSTGPHTLGIRVISADRTSYTEAVWSAIRTAG
jgi:hypothetical protein